MGGDDELRPVLYELMDPSQGGQAVLGGERRFGLVEQVEPVGSEAVEQDRQKRLAMRLLVQRGAALGAEGIAVELLEVAGRREQTLGAQKEVGSWSANAAHESNRVLELRVDRPVGEREHLRQRWWAGFRPMSRHAAAPVRGSLPRARLVAVQARASPGPLRGSHRRSTPRVARAEKLAAVPLWGG